jgi:hypothetical protein
VRSRLLPLLLAAAFALAACRKRAAPTPPPTASAAPARSAVLLDPPPADSTVVTGPAGPGANRAQREQAVIALLRGQAPSERFPVLATEDGGAVDPSLRDQLAPRPDE